MMFTVAVTFTDRTRLPNGRYREFLTHVDVIALSDTEARLVAVQMATAIRADLDVMPLGDRIVAVAI